MKFRMKMIKKITTLALALGLLSSVSHATDFSVAHNQGYTGDNQWVVNIGGNSHQKHSVAGWELRDAIPDADITSGFWGRNATYDVVADFTTPTSGVAFGISNMIKDYMAPNALKVDVAGYGAKAARQTGWYTAESYSRQLFGSAAKYAGSSLHNSDTILVDGVASSQIAVAHISGTAALIKEKFSGTWGHSNTRGSDLKRIIRQTSDNRNGNLYLNVGAALSPSGTIR